MYKLSAWEQGYQAALMKLGMPLVNYAAPLKQRMAQMTQSNMAARKAIKVDPKKTTPRPAGLSASPPSPPNRGEAQLAPWL